MVAKGKGFARWALVVLVLIHFLLVLLIFPFSGLLSSDPINYNDYMLHYFHWKNFASYMESDGKAWGYNPFWMAGYPDNTVYDVENKAVELLTYAASEAGLDDVRAFKLVVFGTFLAGPFLTFWSARNFGFARRQAVLITALQVVFWHSIPFSRVMVVTGAFAYAFLSYVALFTLSVLYRYLSEKKTGLLLALAILCPLALLWHVFATVVIAVPGLILYLLHFRSLPWRMHLGLASVGALTLLVNLFWLVPMFSFLHYSTVSGASLIQGSLPVFLLWSILGLAMAPGLLLVVALSVKGFRLVRQEQGRTIFLFLALTALFFLVVGALGRYTPVTRMLVGLRYHVNVFQYLAFPGALGLIWAWDALRVRYSGRKASTLALAGLCSLAVLTPLLMTAGLANAPADNNPVAWFFSRTLDNAVSDNPHSTALIEWLRENTTPEGRVLVESVWSPMESEEQAWFYMHYIPILPLLTEREFVGGPRDDTLLVHHFSGFHLNFVSFEQLAEGHVPMVLFEKPIETISERQLAQYLDLYNVGWVVCSRPISKEYFGRFPDLVSQATQIGDVWIYNVKRDFSFLAEGKAQVEATYNTIQVQGWSGGDVILKYHWLETLRTRPELRMEPVMMLDDPVPFIKVFDAPSSFEIYNGY